MSDYSNVIQGMFGAEPASNVTSNIDVNPDQSARAYQLQNATGIPASIISGDLESFETQSKASMANAIVSKNAYIQDYVQRHPLASQISNDDYGNLDRLSEGLEQLKRSEIHPMWQAAFDSAKAVAYSYGEIFKNVGQEYPLEELRDHRLRASLAASLDTAVALGQTTLNIPFTAAKAYAESRLGPESGEMMGAINEGLMATIGVHGELPGAAAHADAWARALPYLREGEVPPRGVHPLIDQIKVQQNQTALQLLDSKVSDAQSVLTRERAPDMVRDFVDQHVQGANIGISGPAAVALYGDRVPTVDDGLLGFVPHLREQLENARETGADVTVPMADWISKVDPQVHKALHDDLRVVPEGITAREAVEAQPYEPKPVVDETIPVVRAANGLEPLFSIGDRKLTIQRMASEGGTFGPEQGFHDFDMINEHGQSVGTINLSEQKGGKRLYVEMINGLGDYYNPNNFGPSLMRSLLRQIKQEFPNAEELTGHRVSGARQGPGVSRTGFDEAIDMPVIRLQLGDVGDTQKFHDLLSPYWEQWSDNVSVLRGGPDLLPKQLEIGRAIKAELQRLAPQAQVEGVRAIDYPRAGGPVKGIFDPKTARMLVSLEHDDPLGTVRHEAIHYLVREGFINEDEWNKLTQASADNGWVQKYGIDRKYANFDHDIQVEESIAEAFRYWRRGEEIVKDPGVFQRIADFIDRLKARIQSILGRDFNWEEVFKRIDEGQVGRRSIDPNVSEGELASIEDQGEKVVRPFQNAKDVGMSIDNYRAYMKLIEERQKADLAKSEARILAEQTKRQTADWKAKSEAMRPDVVKDLNARPDIAADKFLANGELFGKKLENSYKLDRTKLDLVQLSNLPDEYLTGRTGVEPDQIAHLFGYQTGDQMLQALSKLHATRLASGLGRERFMRQLVGMEINRRMEIEHGFLEKNILEDTHDQVLSENQLDLLHEETHALATMAGAEMGQISRDQLVSQLKAKFDALPMNVIDKDKWLREGAKHGQNAETFLLQQNPAEAFKAKQAQYYNTIYAKFAKDVEKARAQLDKTAKQFKKTEIKNIEPEYLNHIQNLLQQAGYRVGRSPDNIRENLERRQATLEEFVGDKLVESFGYRNIPIAGVIADGRLGPVDGLTTRDFMGFKGTIDALVKNGKDEQKIIKAGETADRQAVVDEMIDHVKTFDELPLKASPGKFDRLKGFPKSMLAAVTNIETFLNRLGRRDPQSVFNKYVIYPAFEAAGEKFRLGNEIAKEIKDIGEFADPNKLVQAPFAGPDGRPFVNFTRRNVWGMLQHAGNRSNWEAFAKGWGQDPDVLMKWLEANTRPEDWKFIQSFGDRVFGNLIGKADAIYERLNGVTIDKIPLAPFTNAHGTFNGWYSPLIADLNYSGKSPLKIGAYDDSDYGHISTANGYTRSRTNATYPISMDPAMTMTRINQMIHDVAYREFVLNTQKLFKSSALKDAITARYGADYNTTNLLMPWLRDIAGQESTPAKAISEGGRVAEALRQNIIGTYVGFNPGTVFKHGPTAWTYSMRQVGPVNFLRAVKDLFSRSEDINLSNNEYIMKLSNELPMRERFWEDTIAGQYSRLEGKHGLPYARQFVLEKGAWAVAKSDMASAKPTFLAAFRDARENQGLSIGDARDYADSMVRQAHGSIAAPNLPSAVRAGGAMGRFYTSLYGFFGTTMQRRIEFAHDVNDAYKFMKEGEFNSAMKASGSAFTNFMTYWVIPTAIEEAVTGLTTDDRRGLGQHLLAASFMGLSSTVLYVRDVVRSIESGHDPNVGILDSAVREMTRGFTAPFRHDAFSKGRAGKTVSDTLTAFGHTTGMAPRTVDNSLRFGIDLYNGQAHPRSLGDWYRGFVRGTPKERVEK